MSLALIALTTTLTAAPSMNGMTIQNGTLKNQSGSTLSEPMNEAETNHKDRFTTGDDQKLGSAIREQVVALIGVPDAGAVIIYVDSGDVKLLGRVRNEQLKAKLADLAKGMKGVKSVHNKLETNSK